MPNELLDDNSLEITESPAVALSQLEKDSKRIRFLSIFFLLCHLGSFLFLRIFHNEKFMQHIQEYLKGDSLGAFFSAVAVVELQYLLLFLVINFILTSILFKNNRKRSFKFVIEECKMDKNPFYGIFHLLSMAGVVIIGVLVFLLIIILIMSFALATIFAIIGYFVSQIYVGAIDWNSHQLEVDIAFIIVSLASFYMLYGQLKANAVLNKPK